MRMANGAPGTRNCTANYKIKVIGKWLKAHGASKATPAEVAIGISLDEIERLSGKWSGAHERVAYPLIDRLLTRRTAKA